MTKHSNKKSTNNLRIRNTTAEFLTFSYQTGGDGVEVRVQDGTVWLSQKAMGLSFDTSSDNVGLHLKNIFKDGELSESATTEDFSVVRKEGNRDVERIVKSDVLALYKNPDGIWKINNFTQEELDYIINYDIKYRMGNESGESDDE